MKNEHVIVAHPNVCLCGNYNGKPVGCSEIIEKMSWLKEYSKSEKALFLVEILEVLKKDVDA